MGAHSRVGAYSRGGHFFEGALIFSSSVTCRNLLHVTIYKHFSGTNNKAITTKLIIAYLALYHVDKNLCVQISNKFAFQRNEVWGLIGGMGAYSKGRLLDIPVSRVGAYSRGRLVEALR